MKTALQYYRLSVVKDHLVRHNQSVGTDRETLKEFYRRHNEYMKYRYTSGLFQNPGIVTEIETYLEIFEDLNLSLKFLENTDVISFGPNG